jgi:hypothetical protein
MGQAVPGVLLLVKLDLQALEQEMGFDVETTRPWWRCLIRR